MRSWLTLLICTFTAAISISALADLPKPKQEQTYILRQEINSKKENEIELILVDRKGTQTTVLRANIKSEWLGSATLLNIDSGSPTLVAFSAHHNSRLMFVFEAGVKPFSKNLVSSVNGVLTPYDNDRVITRDSYNRLYLVDQLGNENPYSDLDWLQHWGLSQQVGKLNQVEFIGRDNGKDQFVALAKNMVVVAETDLNTKKTTVLKKLSYPDFTPNILVATYEKLVDFVTDGRHVWFRYEIVVPQNGMLDTKQVLYLIDLNNPDVPIAKIEVDLQNPVVQLLNFETDSLNLIARENGRIVRYEADGTRDIVKDNALEKHEPAFAYNLKPGVKEVKVLFSSFMPDPKPSKQKPIQVIAQPTPNRPIDIEKVRKEFFRLDHGTIKYIGFKSISGVRDISLGEFITWYRILSSYGFFWKNSPFMTLSIEISNDKALSSELAALGLEANREGELFLVPSASYRDDFSMKVFLNLLAKAEASWDQKNPQNTVNYRNALDYFSQSKAMGCEMTLLGY